MMIMTIAMEIQLSSQQLTIMTVKTMMVIVITVKKVKMMMIIMMMTKALAAFL